MVREMSPIVSNWRSQVRAEELYFEHGIPVIADVDTRGLSAISPRPKGAMRGIIATGKHDE